MKSTNEPRLSYRIGHYSIDGQGGEITHAGIHVDLTPQEFEVTYQIVSREGAIVPFGDIAPWREPENTQERRHPLDNTMVNIRKKLGKDFILRLRGKGLRLSPKFSVERINSPSRSEVEQLLAVALDQVNMHTSAGFRANIETCEEFLENNQIADVYVYLGLAYLNLGHVGLSQEIPNITAPKVRAILSKALRRFPTLGSAYALRGLAALIYDFNAADADGDLRKGLECSPENELVHCFLSHLRVSQGSFDEGLEHARHAARIDYKSPMTVATEPWMMLYAGRISEALITGEDVVHRFGQSGPAHDILGQIYLAAGSLDKAIDQYNLALERDFLPSAIASLGYIYGRQGQKTKALHCLTELRNAQKDRKIAYVSSYFEALVYAGLGDISKTLQLLTRAFDEKCDWLIYLAVEPRWKELRTDKTFQELVRRVGVYQKNLK